MEITTRICVSLLLPYFLRKVVVDCPNKPSDSISLISSWLFIMNGSCSGQRKPGIRGKSEMLDISSSKHLIFKLSKMSKLGRSQVRHSRTCEVALVPNALSNNKKTPLTITLN